MWTRATLLSKSFQCWSVAVIAFDLAVVFLTWRLWDWLTSPTDSPSEVLRNVFFVLATPPALLLAVWRSLVSERQAQTAQRTLQNERFQRAYEMLGSEVPAVRLGGIFALNQLATEYPEQYHVQVMELLCAYVRTPIEQPVPLADFLDENGNPKRDVIPREDIQAIVNVLKNRTQAMRAVEMDRGFKIWLDYADLTAVRFFDVDLNHASLWGANLTKACFWGTNLLHASLEIAILNGTSFSNDGEDPVINLTQWQLDRARASSDRLPQLDGVLDVETGNQLVWNGHDLIQ